MQSCMFPDHNDQFLNDSKSNQAGSSLILTVENKAGTFCLITVWTLVTDNKLTAETNREKKVGNEDGCIQDVISLFLKFYFMGFLVTQPMDFLFTLGL